MFMNWHDLTPPSVNDVTVNTRNVCKTHVNALHGKHCMQLMSATQCIANAFHFGCLCFLCYSNMAVEINAVYTLKALASSPRQLLRHDQRVCCPGPGMGGVSQVWNLSTVLSLTTG